MSTEQVIEALLHEGGPLPARILSLRNGLSASTSSSEAASLLQEILDAEGRLIWAFYWDKEEVERLRLQTQLWLARTNPDLPPEDQEELAQECMTRLLEGSVQLEITDDPSQGRSVLGLFLRRKLYSLLQEEAQEPLLQVRGLRPQRGVNLFRECLPLTEVEDWGEEPSNQDREEAIRVWARTTIQSVHRRAPDRYFRIFSAVYLEERPLREVAESEGVTYARLQTILEKIRATLREHPYED